MNISERISTCAWGTIKKVVVTYENGEKFYEIDGDKYMCQEQRINQIDENDTTIDLVLRKIVPIRNFKGASIL